MRENQTGNPDFCQPETALSASGATGGVQGLIHEERHPGPEHRHDRDQHDDAAQPGARLLSHQLCVGGDEVDPDQEETGQGGR